MQSGWCLQAGRSLGLCRVVPGGYQCKGLRGQSCWHRLPVWIVQGWGSCLCVAPSRWLILESQGWACPVGHEHLSASGADGGDTAAPPGLDEQGSVWSEQSGAMTSLPLLVMPLGKEVLVSGGGGSEQSLAAGWGSHWGKEKVLGAVAADWCS